VCKFLRDGVSDIHDYMFNLNVRINRLKGTEEDVMQVSGIFSAKLCGRGGM
jgi:hypothetical protein